MRWEVEVGGGGGIHGSAAANSCEAKPTCYQSEPEGQEQLVYMEANVRNRYETLVRPGGGRRQAWGQGSVNSVGGGGGGVEALPPAPPAPTTVLAGRQASAALRLAAGALRANCARQTRHGHLDS